MKLRARITGAAVALLAATSFLSAETGAEGWLRYQHISPTPQYNVIPLHIAATGASPIEHNAAIELQRGLHSMLGRDYVLNSAGPAITLDADTSLAPGAFTITRTAATLHIAGGGPEGELYGVFRLLELIAQQKPLPSSLTEAPATKIRWLNQWDNLDGSIERGYAGQSIFFENGHVRQDLTRAAEYARLLASVGLNGATVNNVNSDLRTMTPEMIHEFARIADVFRPWGVRLSLSVDLSSPKVVGKLPTFDPLDPEVVKWWQAQIDEIYKEIPDFGGFVIKADSEGRPGPSQYGRTPAQAANVVARALKPHGGIVLYRGFVYNNHLDWNDLKADRARAGYDNFRHLDGQFEPNVIIQIKHGPIDFQVREPVSPLFAALQQTPQAIELQITQEYTGQQRHMVWLVPMWKVALDTDLRANNQASPVKEIVEGKTFHQNTGGFVGVANLGLDINWLHHPMAMANLYGFAKLAWNPDLSSEEIIDSWTRLTWGNNPTVVRTIDRLQLGSWKAYEDYTGNLGIGGLTNILSYHYGPGIESAERNGWGQWFRGDRQGIGMDRSVATGTGYIGQYPPELAAQYESLATCPDDLLLFMHHVPYNYKLHSGKTVVEHVYDAHYAGAAVAASYAPTWQKLKAYIDPERYEVTLNLFTYQAGHAIVWRDAVSRWFAEMSGIADRANRVGKYPYRMEAESMTANGYTTIDVKPWETASGSKAVECRQSECSLTAKFTSPAGIHSNTYTVAVRYFDTWAGKSKFDLNLNGKWIGHWLAEDTLPPARFQPDANGDTSTLITIPNLSLKTGDTLKLVVRPDGKETGAVDYIEVTPVK